MGTYNSNVIRMSSSGRERSPGQRILRDCRDRLCKALLDWLNVVHEEIAEDFFVLADGTNERLLQTRYLDLRSHVQKRWPELTSAFLEAFHTGETQPPSSALSLDLASLELVDDSKLSENIVVREFSARLAETCNDELYGLDRRAAILMEVDDVEKIDNPLGPALVCNALSEACGALESKSEERILLLRRIERHLHAALPRIYSDLNGFLVAEGILPDLKRTYRRTAAPSAGNVSPARDTGSPLAIPADSNIFGALQRLVAARNSNLTPGQQLAGSGLPAGSLLGGGAGGNVQGSSIPLDGAALSQTFFASLDQLRQDQFSAGDGGAMVNQIHVIRASDAARQVSHVEAVTIDIVAMLFDFIFNDKNVANGVKALVGRLQIPVLKVAMLDQAFFANRNHPARHFLDKISGIALRWGGNVDQQDPFYITLSGLVERIQKEFECDVEVFNRALEELEKFVESHDQEEETTTKVVADVAARRERESEAWELAQSVVRKAVLETMPAVISGFFKEQWTEVLQKIALNHGTESTHWQDAIKLMPDLVHSIAPKKKPDERMALIGMLPTLLSRINRGLDFVSGDKAARRPFFDALVDLHTAALKGEHLSLAKPAAPQPASSEAAPISPEGDIIITRSFTNGVEVEEVTLVGAKPAWRSDDREVARQVAELKRGDWVEFRQEDDSAVRERLTWISPQRHILVFSNHRAAKAISISPDALARKIREGQAAIVSDESLFERAMSGVLESLNAA